MSVLDKLTIKEYINLKEIILNKKSMTYHTYDSDKELFKFYFSFTEKESDYLHHLTKLMPFVYYEYSKRKLEASNFGATVFTEWPDTHMSTNEPYYLIASPIYAGISLFDKSNKFLSNYKKALFDLLKEKEREKQPEHYYIFPLLTFKNIINVTFDDGFCSFFKHYGYLWGNLHYYLYRTTRNGNFSINHGVGYQRYTDVKR